MVTWEMMQLIREVVVLLFLALCSRTASRRAVAGGGEAYWQSWRVAVEANSVRAWRVVPRQCLRYIQSYMTSTSPSKPSLASWITRCEPYDPVGFRAWATRGVCPAIPSVLRLFNKLVNRGIKVFMVTGRSQETYARPTVENLRKQGFIGYERLILRTDADKTLSAVAYKSKVRKELIGEGYKMRGNVGDQWSDLQGDCVGNRTFKLPNPMYFVP